MAGSFGCEAEHHEASMAMAELSLLPAVRKVDADTLVVADGTSCRHQIADGADRRGSARRPGSRHRIGVGIQLVQSIARAADQPCFHCLS